MGLWEQIGTILIATALANIVSAIIFYWWRKRQEIPEDYAALKSSFDSLKASFESQKAMAERMIRELDDRHKDFAVIQMQQSRDMVGLRGEIKYIRGVINGTHWKRSTDG